MQPKQQTSYHLLGFDSEKKASRLAVAWESIIWFNTESKLDTDMHTYQLIIPDLCIVFAQVTRTRAK